MRAKLTSLWLIHKMHLKRTRFTPGAECVVYALAYVRAKLTSVGLIHKMHLKCTRFTPGAECVVDA